MEGNTPCKTLRSSKVIENIFPDYLARAKKSERTIIAGAGLIGIEVAGELGFEYIRQKEFILVSSRRLEPLFIELYCYVPLC
jgi:NADH dehydrogenase FAD-containing subunit